MQTSASKLRGPLLALLAFAIFSSHDVIVKYLGGNYSPFQIVFFSVLMGFPLAMIMLMRDRTDGTLLPRHPWWTALRTIAAVVTGVCAFYAFSVLPMTETYAILFAAPLLITVLSIPILGEKVGIHRGVAVVVGLCGVLVVLRPWGETSVSLGHGAALAAAIGSSVSSIIVRKIGHDERNVVLLLYPMMANFVVMACFLPFFYKPMPLQDFAGFAAIAVFAFAASLCVIAAYKAADAVLIAPMQYSQIIWAAIFGYLFFNETSDLGTVIGAGIIILSGLYILSREARKNVSQNTPVLQTRSRADTGTMPRISLLTRLAIRSKS
jgi:drug/metabolite transporter (DMT)-like permease